MMKQSPLAAAVATTYRYRSLMPVTINSMSKALACNRFMAALTYLKSAYTAAKQFDEFSRYCSRGAQHLIEQASSVRVAGSELSSQLASTQRPVLVVTIHMGHFQLGLLKLLSQVQTEKKLSIFKVNPEDANELVLLEALRRIGHSVEVFRTGLDGGRNAFLALRRGQVVVLALDLEVRVQSRSPVELLGHSCLMQNGPAMIATLTKSIILPVVATTERNGEHKLIIEEPIDSAVERPGETLAQRVDRLTQTLATLQDKWIKAHPAAPHLWAAIAQTLATERYRVH